MFDEKVLKYFYQLKQSNEERILKQFQCKFWPEEANVPENPDPMLEMIEEVNKWQCQVNNPTIVVHCMYVVGCRFLSYAQMHVIVQWQKNINRPRKVNISKD